MTSVREKPAIIFRRQNKKIKEILKKVLGITGDKNISQMGPLQLEKFRSKIILPKKSESEETIVYRKVETDEVDKIIILAKNNMDFYLGSKEMILKNWLNIEAIGGFCHDKLVALLITDPYNLVRWSTGGRATDRKSNSGDRIEIKTASLLDPVISPDFVEKRDAITGKLLEAYFDNMNYCDEIVLYIITDPEDVSRRNLLREFGFEADEKFPRKMVLKSKWGHFSEKKRNKILESINFSLKKLGLAFEEIEKDLFYTKLLVDNITVVIYIVVEKYEKRDYIIKFFSYLAVPAGLNIGIIRYLLELNYSSFYGNFCIDPDGRILMINSKIGQAIDERDIEIFIKQSIMVIIKYTEEIIDRFGGTRIFDVILRNKPFIPSDYKYLFLKGNCLYE